MEIDGAWAIAVCVFLVLFSRPLLDEFWTLVQLAKSFFTPPADLKRKYGAWAVVTGCTDGIGRAFALELAARGLNVVLIARNQDKLNSVSDEIRTMHGVQTKLVKCDFSRGREIYGGIRESLSDLDVGLLVNNVGIQYTHPMYFSELPEDELWDVLNVNMGAVTQMTRIVLPHMLGKGRGAVVNVSSGSKLQPLPFMNLYAASKIFTDFFTEALRSEHRNSGITFQSLCPYYVSTKINHFSRTLLRVNVFVPTPERYVKSALDTLGVVDNTTGYWPHRLQYLVFLAVPVWIKVYVGGLFYKMMRRDYLNPRQPTMKKSS